MTANNQQIGGTHYKKMPIEHWDIVALLELDYFQGQITKYVMRWRDKGGLVDLEKARHVTDKYIEIETLKEKLGHNWKEALLDGAYQKYRDELHKEKTQAVGPVQPHGGGTAPWWGYSPMGVTPTGHCVQCGHVPPMHAGNCTAQR